MVAIFHGLLKRPTEEEVVSGNGEAGLNLPWGEEDEALENTLELYVSQRNVDPRVIGRPSPNSRPKALLISFSFCRVGTGLCGQALAPGVGRGVGRGKGGLSKAGWVIFVKVL